MRPARRPILAYDATSAKLRSLYDLAQERGMDYVATGHYARVQQARNMDTAPGVGPAQGSKLFPVTSSAPIGCLV